MGVSASDKRCGQAPWRLLLLLAALDALAWGLFWGARPGELFPRLGMEPRNDAWAWEFFVPRDPPPPDEPPRRNIPAPRDAALWHMLAFVWVAQAGFLALAAWRPRTLGGLAVVPLIGHALGAALWLWALATTYTFPPGRVPFPQRGPLLALAAHDLVWLPLLLAFLLAWRRPGGMAPKAPPG
jgi:hypothetical protein